MVHDRHIFFLIWEKHVKGYLLIFTYIYVYIDSTHPLCYIIHISSFYLWGICMVIGNNRIFQSNIPEHVFLYFRCVKMIPCKCYVGPCSPLGDSRKITVTALYHNSVILGGEHTLNSERLELSEGQLKRILFLKGYCLF